MQQSLNIAESYVPQWSTWDVGRELICNARDADPNFKQEFVGDNTMILTTATTPSIAQLCVLGVSESRKNENLIGQFGEGFKLAALVATRMGGSVEVQLPAGRVTFSLKKIKDLKERVLYVRTDGRSKGTAGSITRLRLPGIKQAVADKFCDPHKIMLFKPELSPCRVFVKGIFIAEFKEKSLYDWNLNTTLNRDRSIINTWDIKYQIAEYLTLNKEIRENTDVFEQIVREKNSLEAQALHDMSYLHTSSFIHDAMQQSWISVYGTHAVIASSDPVVNQRAVSRGFQVISTHSNYNSFGIKTAEDCLLLTDVLTEVQAPDYIQESLAEALRLLNAPLPVLKYYDTDDEGAHYETESVDGKNAIWLPYPRDLPTLYSYLVLALAELHESFSIAASCASLLTILVDVEKED